MSTTEKKINTKANKELKEQLLSTIAKRDIPYYNKCFEDVTYINNNKQEYFVFQKPVIQKSFCFGYGIYLQSTDEEHESACASARKAKEDITYFLNENLSEINSKIAKIKYFLLDNYEEKKKYFKEMYDKGILPYSVQMQEPYITKPYYCSKEIIEINCFRDDDENINREYVLRKATKEELENILKFYEKGKARFIKRLNTYLKKYGLSKVKAWTYLVD